ncbi:hypothetical protein WJX73_004706 [Symbiochloris irregularis]|uniref:Ubiquitin-like domain-containing protein n=1 Tax=Symbiochloris irregularis TaxID=706552 RepID=A0AAW1NXM4_9CHLO
MQLFLRTDRTHTVQADANTTVEDVKNLVQERQGWPAESLRLVATSQELEAGRTLASYGITDEATLNVLARLAGGAKKRKKKTYTKPKKQKHKPKKIKMRILKYYKVDDSGKVQRLRKVCPQPECGPGVFMATHFNRVYCGKCGQTYMYDKGEAEA